MLLRSGLDRCTRRSASVVPFRPWSSERRDVLRPRQESRAREEVARARGPFRLCRPPPAPLPRLPAHSAKPLGRTARRPVPLGRLGFLPHRDLLSSPRGLLAHPTSPHQHPPHNGPQALAPSLGALRPPTDLCSPGQGPEQRVGPATRGGRDGDRLEGGGLPGGWGRETGAEQVCLASTGLTAGALAGEGGLVPRSRFSDEAVQVASSLSPAC